MIYPFGPVSAFPLRLSFSTRRVICANVYQVPKMLIAAFAHAFGVPIGGRSDISFSSDMAEDRYPSSLNFNSLVMDSRCLLRRKDDANNPDSKAIEYPSDNVASANNKCAL